MRKFILTVFAVSVGLMAAFGGSQRAKAAITNDEYINNQTHLRQIKADQAWRKVTGSTVTIAVLDTGVDHNHPDLKGNILPGINLVEPGKSAQDDSQNGHGTAVTGILAARGNNGIGVSGF